MQLHGEEKPAYEHVWDSADFKTGMLVFHDTVQGVVAQSTKKYPDCQSHLL